MNLKKLIELRYPIKTTAVRIKWNCSYDSAIARLNWYKKNGYLFSAGRGTDKYWFPTVELMMKWKEIKDA